MADPQLTAEQIKTKLDDIQRRHARVLKTKAEKSGELKAKREELSVLIKEIKAAGYEPKDLVKERDKLQVELETMLGTLDTQLSEVEKSLATYEKK